MFLVLSEGLGYADTQQISKYIGRSTIPKDQYNRLFGYLATNFSKSHFIKHTSVNQSFSGHISRFSDFHLPSGGNPSLWMARVFSPKVWASFQALGREKNMEDQPSSQKGFWYGYLSRTIKRLFLFTSMKPSKINQQIPSLKLT